MPKTSQSPAKQLLTAMMRFWVKPEVLPKNPLHLINPDLPILYILEVGGVADKAALTIAAERMSLPHPNSALLFGGVQSNNSIVVLRQTRGSLFGQRKPVVSELLSKLVEAGKSSDAGELQIVPVSVYWGRAPDKESSIFRLLFSENWQIATRTRKLMSTLIHGRHTLLSISEPLSLTTLLSSGQGNEILTRKLSRILRVHFRQRRIASLGPDQSHRRMLVDHVLSDTAVRRAIHIEATDSSLEKARKQAYDYAYEISADVSYPTIRILHKLLKRLWNELYDGVELSGVERLKAVADGKEIIYVPCHRSHIDYLLLSYILYVQGFSLPHIAAGINLNLPFVGGLLRRGGAFFLRRSFSGKPLYAAVFNAYLKELLQRGHALEYFVEGGRSRTGRLLPPKGGMLAMTVHAYLSQPQTPVIFIPVYFGYERLLEGRSFTSELAGGKKQRETVFALLKSLRTLREDYGRVYVSFGEPIELDPLLAKHELHWREQKVGDKRPEWVKPVIDELGITIMQHINETASVTPISLLAIAILATPRGCISRDELIQQIIIYQRLLKATYADSLVTIPEIEAQELVKHGARLGFIHTINDAVGPMVSLRPGQATPLNYFRNNILHLLTLPALIAATFTNKRTMTQNQIENLINLTFPFVQGELFLPTKLSKDSLEHTLDGLAQAGLLNKDNDVWSRAAGGSLEAMALTRLANVVHPALERDYLCACLLAQFSDEGISIEKLENHCQMVAERLASTHGKVATELFDKNLHKNFINALHRHGYIDKGDEHVCLNTSLFTVQKKAQAMLSEQSRHAIIAASQEVVDAKTLS